MRGTGTGCWCRCGTRTTRSSASSPLTIPRTGCCRRARSSRALRIFANQAAAAIVAAENLRELRFLADHDPLTRLLNRRAFVARLEAEVARAVRYDRSVGLVICDLDGFKDLNDRFGHLAGDVALQSFAEFVSNALRKPDDAFRIGG